MVSWRSSFHDRIGDLISHIVWCTLLLLFILASDFAISTTSSRVPLRVISKTSKPDSSIIASNNAPFSNNFPVAPTAPTVWNVIGPFPDAMREQGNDVLAAFGGIWNIPIGGDATYPSELAAGGRVGWTQFTANSDGNVQVQWPNITWDYLSGPFGWAVQQFQAWAVGTFQVTQAGSFLVQCLGVEDFYIDQQLIVGDVYGIGYGWFAVTLDKGTHQFYIHLHGMETTEFNCHFQQVSSNNTLIVLPGDDILPDIVAGVIAGEYLSIPILNASPSQWLTNFQVKVNNNNNNNNNNAPINLALSVVGNPSVAPGQAYPLVIYIASVINGNDVSSGHQAAIPSSSCPLNLEIAISAQGAPKPLLHNISMSCSDGNHIFKFTFLDFDQSVQYAVAYPPNNTQACQQQPGGCAVLLTTHGAGSKPEWLIGYYQQQETAWILAPNGRRRFGYDWEGQQLLNAFAALNALGESLPPAIINKRTVNAKRILFAGHSMGGHGCYLTSTHFADFALGAAPASGWIRYQQYIPYYTRNGFSFIDGMLQGILIASITEYSPDLYLPNLVGVPLLARIGGADQEVSPWHPRRMVRMMDQLSGNASKAIMSEIPGEPHWWNGVVDDAQMQAFFDQHIIKSPTLYPELPQKFTVQCTNPGRFGGRGGMVILQLHTPYRLGRIHVERKSSSSSSAWWTLKTENIRRFAFRVPAVGQPAIPSEVVIDGRTLGSVAILPDFHFCKLSRDSKWDICKGDDWMFTERSPSSYGPARQILEGPLMIVYGSKGSQDEVSAQLSAARVLANHFYIQGRSAIQIVQDANLDDDDSVLGFNMILLGDVSTNIWAQRLAPQFPVSFSSREVFTIGDHVFEGTDQDPLGIMFLFPIGSAIAKPVSPEDQRLGLLVAGTNLEAFVNIATQLIPTKSGELIPDYIVANNELAWKGEGAYLAAGYWGNSWEYRGDIGYIRP